MASNLDFSMLDDSLGTDADGIPTKDDPVIIVTDGQIDPRYTRLSYSSSMLLHDCPRKYQLKSLQADKADDESTNITFAFGHSVGFGIAELFATRDLETTLFKMFCEWEVDFFAENEKQKKSIAHAINAIQMLAAQLEDGAYSEYQVAKISGKPAAELSFRVTFPSNYADFTYRGYLDLVLENIMSGELAVLENKTNSGTWVNHYQYKNSSQAIGYSVILDQIEGDKSAYMVLYLVFMTKLFRYEDFEFPKNYHQRALWIRDRLWDIQTIEALVAQEGNYGIWPMHGESCYSFGRTCEYMDVCHLDTANLMAPLRKSQLVEKDRATGEVATYDYEVTLEELL